MKVSLVNMSQYGVVAFMALAVLGETGGNYGLAAFALLPMIYLAEKNRELRAAEREQERLRGIIDKHGISSA